LPLKWSSHIIDISLLLKIYNGSRPLHYPFTISPSNSQAWLSDAFLTFQ